MRGRDDDAHLAVAGINPSDPLQGFRNGIVMNYCFFAAAGALAVGLLTRRTARVPLATAVDPAPAGPK